MSHGCSDLESKSSDLLPTLESMLTNEAKIIFAFQQKLILCVGLGLRKQWIHKCTGVKYLPTWEWFQGSNSYKNNWTLQIFLDLALYLIQWIKKSPQFRLYSAFLSYCIRFKNFKILWLLSGEYQIAHFKNLRSKINSHRHKTKL